MLLELSLYCVRLWFWLDNQAFQEMMTFAFISEIEIANNTKDNRTNKIDK